jgi:hypothetical protein
MWAYYADDNYGIAVGFDEQHSFFGNAKAVSYSNEPISVSINSEWVRIGGVRWETEDILNSRIVQIPDELLFRKGTGWLHESEWRMVRSLANANMTLEKSDRNGFAICLYEVPPEAVRLVIFGYRVPDSIVDETIERIVKGGQLEHLQIYRRKRTNIGRVEEERIR